MAQIRNNREADSIVYKLFRIVFGLYFILTIFITFYQMYSEYKDSRKKIAQDLKVTQKAFEKGLRKSLWSEDYEISKELAKGMIKIPYIEKVKIILAGDEKDIDVEAKSYSKRGDVFFYETKIIKMEDQIEYTLGVIRLYSSGQVVLERVYFGFLLLILTACLKTIILFFLFFWAFKKFLRKPLIQLTISAKKLNFAQLEFIDAQLNKNEYNELNILENTLNKTIENLQRSKKNLVRSVEEKGVMVVKLSDLNDDLTSRCTEVEALNKDISNFNQNLEQKIIERTEDLRQSLETTKGMFSNINKAIFKVDKKGIILDPISSFSQTIFKKDILGLNALQLLFFHLKDGSQEKELLLTGWRFLFDGDDIHFELSVRHLPKKVVQPSKENPKGKVLEIDYVPLFNKEKKVEYIMFIVDDITKFEQEYIYTRDSAINLKIMKEIIIYDDKKTLSHQLGEAIRTSAYSLDEFLLIEAENFELKQTKNKLNKLFNRLKGRDFLPLKYLQENLEILINEVAYKEKIKGKRSQIWAIEKVSFLLECLMKYADVSNLMSDHQLLPKINEELFKIFEGKLEDKKSGLERIMVNLLEYVFLVRKIDQLNEENIKNAPKKAQLYGEFDHIIFYLQIQSKFISFILKMFRKEESSNIYMEFASLLERMPSKNKLTVPSLKNHLITPYKKIEALKE